MDKRVKKQLLRKKLIEQRKILSKEFQRNASEKLFQSVVNLEAFCRAKHIAFYWPVNSEIDSLPILFEALNLNKYCYLPVINKDKQSNKSLLFFPYDANVTLEDNEYGIPEPNISDKEPISIDKLDLIFVPLVGFDKNGYRLGMGGGYYDRALHKLSDANIEKRPKFIGLAYSMQCVDEIPIDDLDVKLDFVITEDILN